MNPKKIGITIASALFVLIGGITGVQYLQDSPEESSSSDALTASGSETTVAATETYQTTAATETTTVSMQTTAPAQTESAPAMTLVSDAKGASYYTFRTDALLESHYEKHGIEMGLTVQPPMKRQRMPSLRIRKFCTSMNQRTATTCII